MAGVPVGFRVGVLRSAVEVGGEVRYLRGSYHSDCRHVCPTNSESRRHASSVGRQVLSGSAYLATRHDTQVGSGGTSRWPVKLGIMSRRISLVGIHPKEECGCWQHSLIFSADEYIPEINISQVTLYILSASSFPPFRRSGMSGGIRQAAAELQSGRALRWDTLS